MDYQSIVTFVMEMAGSVAFAASGAMVGVERNMDIFGVSVLGVATAVGGGMIRDIVLGIIPPAVFTNPVYALVSVLASCIVFFIFYFKRELLQGHRRETYDKIMLAMDSVGLGIFTVVGVNTGIRQGYMVAFAASGAMVGVERNMDIFGVSVLGVATAVGGGMIRDIVLGIIPPAVFTNPVYALVSVLASCIVFFIFYFKRELLQGHRRETYDKIMLAMDSVGLGIFTVVGVNTGIRQGYMDNVFLLVFLGTITGVGGGLLRDMMASVPPYIFVKHIYACASIIGAVVCVYMNRFVGNVQAMVVSSIVVVLIRYLAAHYRWNLPRLSPHE